VLALTQPEATLTAAIVAACASVLSLAITARAARRAERRAAQRTLVEGTVAELSKAFHENVATAATLLKKSKGSESRANNLDLCRAARDRLKALRPQVRIALQGIDGGLQALSRVPDWAANYDDATAADEFLKRADALRKALDAVVGRAYRRGRPPWIWEQWWVDSRAKRVRTVWEKDFGGRNRGEGTEVRAEQSRRPSES
jgi:hypothetical protein